MSDQLTLSNEIKYLTIDELVNGFDSGELEYTNNSHYIRQQCDLIKCQESLIFAESNLENENTGNISAYCQILEPILFEVLPNGVKRLVNGNTRCKSLLDFTVNPVKQLLGNTYEVVSYADIPYRVFNRQLSDEEYIYYQVGLNDSTQEHNDYELALSVVLSKCKLEDEYTGKRNKSGGLPKNVASDITRKLCELYKKSSSTISSYVSVVTCTSPVFRQYLIDGKMSVIVADYIIQSSNKNGLDVDLAMRNIIGLLGGDSDANITKNLVKLYFSDYEKSLIKEETESDGKKSDGKESDGKESEDIESEDTDSPKELDSSSYIKSVLENLKILNISELDDRLTFPLSEINKRMINVIYISYPYLEIDEITKQIFANLFELTNHLTDVEGIDESEITKIVNAFKSLDNSLSKFLKTKRQLEQSQVVLDI